MRCGLFGKLSSKPDYIAIEAPRGFLSVFEPWLQACVASSHQQLGGDWREAFLAAPIWRFWLGSDISGATILGAFMPSIDDAGKYFPLALFAAADPGMAMPPPEFDAHDAWFMAAENLLLSTLGPGMTFEKTMVALERLAPPAAYAPVAATQGATCLSGGGAFAPIDGSSPSRVFASLRLADWAAAYASRSFWWTSGGAGFQPLALAMRHMPSPTLYAAMLSGDFRGHLAP